MAAKVGLSSSKEAEEQIVAMIQEGSIHARISQKDGKLSPIATDIEVNIGESNSFLPLFDFDLQLILMT